MAWAPSRCSGLGASLRLSHGGPPLEARPRKGAGRGGRAEGPGEVVVAPGGGWRAAGAEIFVVRAQIVFSATCVARP